VSLCVFRRFTDNDLKAEKIMIAPARDLLNEYRLLKVERQNKHHTTHATTFGQWQWKLVLYFEMIASLFAIARVAIPK
jgi:hypothetical protein